MAGLEERFDGVIAAIADLKAAVSKLDDHMDAGFAQMHAEMNTQFRWILGSIGGATLAILVAVLTAILAKG